jgi:hypothetical protein
MVDLLGGLEMGIGTYVPYEGQTFEVQKKEENSCCFPGVYHVVDRLQKSCKHVVGRVIFAVAQVQQTEMAHCRLE